MDIERVSAELRPRNSWEAIDLGFALVRSYAGPLYGAWLLGALPLVLGMGLGSVWLGLPWLAPLLLWWCKPMLDRVPLHVLSRALFGAVPPVADVLRATPGLWWRRLAHALTLARMDPMRAVVAPIFQLEGQVGYAARRRRQVLSLGLLGSSLGLFGVCHMLEWVLVIGGVVFAALLLPDTPEYAASALWSGFWDGTAPAWFSLLVPLGYGLAVLAVEPLYVAGGFSLYLNRRTGLEGWDVEVAFRRLAARLAAPARRFAGLFLAFFLASAAVAAEVPWPDTAAAAPGSPEAAVQQVLARPEFPHTETTSHWRWRFQRDEPDLPVPSLGVGALFGSLLEVLLWAALALAVVALVVVLLRSRGPTRSAEAEEHAPVAVLGMGLDLRPESLPRNLADAALALWQAGRRLDALALLYRGALVDLITQRQMLLEEGATERDCLRLAAPILNPRATSYFIRLTGVWQEAAYAHRFPDDEVAGVLCRRWPEHFRGVA